jgi:hypothetical protein
MPNFEDSNTSPHKSSPVRKVRWFGHFGPSQMNKEIEQTSPEGQFFDFREKSHSIFVSPVQKRQDQAAYPRQQIAVYIKKRGDTMTKGQAKAAISQVLGVTLEKDFILEPMLIEHRLFIRQFWKTSHPVRTEAEQKILDCICELEMERIIIDFDKLNARLREREGVSFTQKNKLLIETMTRSSDCFTNKVTVFEPIDHAENFENVATVAATFTRILHGAIQTNSYKTSHSKFKNLSDSEMTLAVTMIAILPMLVERTKNPDNIPALYFYGDAGTGKSFFFNQHPCYHMVATDAPGVSRYQKNTNVDGYLLDDITSDTLEDRSNSTTVKLLALGGPAKVKIYGGTQLVRAFIVCTSNDTPNFLLEEELKDPDLKNNDNAWRRRFIAINFTTPVDEDPINAQFGYMSATDALKCYFVFCYNLLEASDVKNMFQKYYLAISESLSPDFLNTFKGFNLVLPSFMDIANSKHPESKRLKTMFSE